MDLNLTEEQELIQETAREVLGGRVATAGVAAVAADPVGFSADLWKEMVELGWTGLAIPESADGVGAGFLEACLLIEELGAAQVPGPFPHTVTCAAVLERHGHPDRLREIAAGRSVVFAEGAAVTATRSDTGHVLDGTARYVPFAASADDVLVVARSGDTETAFLVETSGLTCEPLDTVSLHREYEVRFDRVPIPADRVVGTPGDGAAVAATAALFGAAATCAEMVGGAQRVLDMSVEYATQREQFGRAIGANQAVQHLCADMAADVLTGRYLAYEAIWRLGSARSPDTETALAVSVAKAWLSDRYVRVCERGHQVHGAIGFTAEHVLHHYLRHALGAAGAFGDGAKHEDLVAGHIGL